MGILDTFRRRNEPALVASGEQINLESDKAINAVLKRREEWQDQVVKHFHVTGEIQNGCTQVADLMSGLVSFPAVQPVNTDAKPSRTDDAVAKKTAARLGSITDVSQLLYDISLHLLTIGETQLLGIQPREDRGIYVETWVAYSHLELEKESIREDDGTIRDTIKIPEWQDGEPLVLDPTAGDTWIRIWRPDPFRKSKANSHVRALLGPADELLWWDWAASAVAKNRLVTAGAVGIPSNLELPPEAGEDPRVKDSTRFMRRMKNVAIKTLQNPGAASAAVPIFFTYPWNEQGKSGLDIINFERKQDELLEKRTDRSLRRIAQGFPLPVESFFGVNTASQFGAREISESKFRENVEPFAKFVFAALTAAWYRPILREEGLEDWQRHMLWYDAAGVIVHPDITQAADKGVEYGAINLQGWRRLRGVPESDAPSDAEREEMLEWMRAMKGSPVASPDDPAHPGDADSSPDEPTKQVEHQGHAPRELPAAPARRKGQPVLSSANGHSVLGRDLAEIDSDLLSRVQVMADASMRRALEKAGNKLKSRANRSPVLKEKLKGVSGADVARSLGRQAVINLGMSDLFDDSFDTVVSQFSNWCDRAVEAAFVASGIPADHRKDAAFQLACGTDEAAQSFVRDLREHAATLLFDSATSDVPQPEADDLLVPAKLVRKALSLAGGSPVKVAGTVLLATGPAVIRTLASHGHYANDWRWRYGPTPRHPHAAHQRLDGSIIDLDGPLTASPGDVTDCKCVLVPEFA